MGKHTREDIIRAAKDAAEANGGVLSRADFERCAGISQYHIYQLFPKGGWAEVRTLAGIGKHTMDHPRLTDDSILMEYHRVVRELGRLPRSWAEFGDTASISADVIRRRFGGSKGVIAQYRTWLGNRGLDVAWLGELAPPPAPSEDRPRERQSRGGAGSWTKTHGPEYGAPLNFRGLQHAPINELGVVYLFGMVSTDLNIIVESVQQAFPDCEAKRCVDEKRQRWQRVRIEFEFRSSHFREHGHDLDGCDLIVCWEHDWPDCPLEVVELRSALERLGQR